MRAKLALAGLTVGVVAAIAPLSTASAQCTPPPALGGHSRNKCMDNGCDTYDALKAKFPHLPDRPYDCTL
jgi:hypothetical protein